MVNLVSASGKEQPVIPNTMQCKQAFTCEEASS